MVDIGEDRTGQMHDKRFDEHQVVHGDDVAAKWNAQTGIAECAPVGRAPSGNEISGQCIRDQQQVPFTPANQLDIG